MRYIGTDMVGYGSRRKILKGLYTHMSATSTPSWYGMAVIFFASQNLTEILTIYDQC